MSDGLAAAHPRANAAVLASAGTGKTWLLVTRLVRLLLHGARPDAILAVTFTRKAAAEMLARLEQRLGHYALLDDAALDRELTALGETPDEALRSAARGLYERLLFAERPVRTTTFHAFCQEILERFPLEADVPPGFELLETSGLLEQEAWDALYGEATAAPDGNIARALERLYDQCDGLHNTHSALGAFLQHRSDWWAYVDDWADPVASAEEVLREWLALGPDEDPDADFLACSRALVQDFARLLGRHDTKENLKHAQLITEALAGELDAATACALLRGAFLTAQGDARKRGPNKTRRKRLGEADDERFLQLHERICAALHAADETRARLHTLELCSAWYLAGQRLLEHFQRIKRERRWLDFTDLEWRTHCLLTRSDNAHWVQYKLDQRIDHFLVDEFQDTNPTQWQLLLPLLEELAAGGSGRERSVFLVGDDKQSIYRFRRAEPRLLASAAELLESRLGAHTATLARSWRSSPAVIQAVNAVFEGPLAGAIPSFVRHETHHAAHWGRVQVLPLSEAAPPEATTAVGAGLRNPLELPRELAEDRRHYQEGCQIAACIRALVEDATTIGAGDEARPVGFGDIYILIRSRTHAQPLEQALRDAGIPYVGAGRGTLLASLEITDFEALLNTLIMPFDNLALAQVLRSPLFAAADDDLLRVAEAADGGPWSEGLDALAPTLAPHHPLARAQRLLRQWSALAGAIPVHDLLDRIYSDADVIARYQAAFPAPLRGRVRSNLARFIALALEVDSGRYPSLPHFLDRLRRLRDHALEAPDEPPSDGGEARVRIMTVHGAKGLEAPVVFLADAAAAPRPRHSYRALVHWPPGSPRPQRFLLTAKRTRQDQRTRELLDDEARAQEREDANLLYVALTRARQLLVISASAPGRGDDLGWYGRVREALAPVSEPRPDGSLVLEVGHPPPVAAASPVAPAPTPEIDPRLAHRLTVPARWQEIAPSRQGDSTPCGAADADGRARGIAIHRMLELLDGGAEPGAVLRQVAAELGLEAGAPAPADWLAEAEAVRAAPALALLFDRRRFQCAYNEVPVQYADGERLVHGIIDRLVDDGERVLVIDYKTHRLETTEAATLAAAFAPQMRLYAEAVRRLWPGRRVCSILVFTHRALLHELGST